MTCFASNIARLETILKVSEELNKCCVFVGRSIHRIYDSATENNYLCDFKNIISEKDSLSVNDDDLVIICTVAKEKLMQLCPELQMIITNILVLQRMI